jgi:endonuclease/exonuclease/phosphatase family metal-dependent hydrolase
MRRLILLMMLSVVGFALRAQENEKKLAMFWNLENFFDWTDQGTGESDAEFSSYGKRHWTRKRFYTKCDAVSKTIFHIGDLYGKLPDVIGFAEIENRGVLEKLCSSTLLRKCGYRIVHFDSSDRRGIDVALLYRTTCYNHLSTSLRAPETDGKKLQTRDMLHVSLKDLQTDEIYDYIVCHHPSKFGGEESSIPKRLAAMTALKEMCDSLGNRNIIVMGDFNDVPSAAQFDMLDDILVNKSDSLHAAGRGTIRYEGKWDLIDMFLVSSNIEGHSVMDIPEVPFLMTRESRHAGEKPLRTYSGPRYIGGVSDHLPVVLYFRK